MSKRRTQKFQRDMKEVMKLTGFERHEGMMSLLHKYRERRRTLDLSQLTELHKATLNFMSTLRH
jgi:hypothetical protein